MRYVLVFGISLLLLLPFAQAYYQDGSDTQKQQLTHVDLMQGGRLDQQENITILYVNGSHYQMGYQHGYLLQEKVQQNIRAFIHFAEEAISYDDLLDLWSLMSVYVPAHYLDEIQGLADGANVSFEDIAVCITAIEYGDQGCYGIAAWGPATSDARMYHARSFDLPSTIQDPISGRYVHENSVLVVRNPASGYASLAPSIAGSFHTGGGINEQGISLGIQVCWSKDQTFQGNPYHFRVQQVLDSAATAQEAIVMVNTNRTHGFNYIISQANPPEGYIVEQTENHTYIGTYDDDVESISPFWSIDHVVRRTNVFLEPTIAATQRRRYDPTGLIGFLNLLFYKRTNSPFFAVFQLYSSVSKEITASWGSIDLNETMRIMKQGYHAEDNLLFRLIKRLGRGTGLAEAWNQWTACPSTGDMVVCFATHDTLAFDSEPHYFNLYDLLLDIPE